MMTERPLSISTQVATPLQTTFNSTPSNSTNDALPIIESTEEEPYTIRCICDFSDDDGNTIYCENCETWQHIECYYPGRVDDASREEFDHICAVCKPRDIDRRLATERQRHQRQNKVVNEAGDKKSKRPPSKSHKKKSKPSDLQVNGYHDHDNHKNKSPHEHHPHAKKTKGHRSSQSVGSQLKRSPPFNARSLHHGHPPSPAHTPPDLPHNFQIHGYSDLFLALFEQDHMTRTTSNNSFASLPVTNSLALWIQEPEKLRQDVGLEKEDVFQFLTVPLDQLQWFDLRVETKKTTINNTLLRWRQIITPGDLPQAGRIGELNGLVGIQKDYCDDPRNRWTELAHPHPLVFFHPQLPIFIDTRQEGSICRHVRRSCRANTNLETFIALGHEYHFWLTSERALAANEMITLPWDFRFPSQYKSRYLHLLNLSDEDGAPSDGSDITDEEYEQLTLTIYQVLSDHGGCACDLGNDCAFARFHRNYHGRSHPQSNGVKPKKGRKPKQNHVSPTSTGHATNSRAASEGQQDQFEEDDGRSVSGSTRSKPQSRDLTPSHGLSGETNGNFTEPSDREKRKLAALEDTFRKMEQPPRKKKRASDSSAMSVPTSTTTSQATPKPRQRSVAPRMSISQPPLSTTNGNRSRYVDANASRRQSGSPFSALSPTAVLPSPDNQVLRNCLTYSSRQASAAPKATYCDASTQTDEVVKSWWKQQKPTAKRSIVPLSKRLLKNQYRSRSEVQPHQETTRNTNGEDRTAQSSPTALMDVDVSNQDEQPSIESSVDAMGRTPSISSSVPVDEQPTPVDVVMTDAPGLATNPPPPPWPDQNGAVPDASQPRFGQFAPDLRVQLPPAPVFSAPNMSGSLSGPVTPSPGSGSIAQSPLGTIHPVSFATSSINGLVQNASPVKTTKKMSLSDYKARFKRTDTLSANKTSSGTSPVVTPATLKTFSPDDNVKMEISENSNIVHSPVLEESADSLGPMTGLTSSTQNTPPEKVNNAL